MQPAKRAARSFIRILLAFGLALTAPFVAANPEPRILSAFFGLDDGISLRASVICTAASGQDGMPLVFSLTVDAESIQPEDFEVVTRSGARHAPYCVTLWPATDPGENRTVLMIGDLGDAANDPPQSVHVIGDVMSHDTGVNFRGSRVSVTPLDAGPSLVLGEIVPEPPRETRGSACPDDTAQIVRVTWAGGVRRPDRAELDDAERRLYRVTVERTDGSGEELIPAAIADLGDRDNNHLLCLDTADPAISVSFPAGHLVDPNQDLNPATEVAIQ